MTNSDELREEFEEGSRRPWIFLAVGMGILAVAVALGFGPGWARFKKWRADTFLSESDRAAKRGDHSVALDLGRAALQLVPSDADAIRFNARLLDQLGSDSSLLLWKQLLEGPAATLEDRESYAEAALKADRIELMPGDLVGYLGTTNGTPRGGRIASLYEFKSGHLSNAVLHARRVFRAEPGNPTNAVLLASVLAAQSTPESRAEARRLFWEGAKAEGSVRTEALRNLVRPDLGARQDRERVAALLGKLEKRTPAEDAIWFECRMLLDPSSVSVLASNLVAGIPRDDTERLSLAVDVLLRQARYQDVLRLTIADRGFRSPVLFNARHAALLETGQIEEAYRHVMNPGAQRAPYPLEKLRAVTAQAIPDPRRRDTHLSTMLRFAEGHPGRLREVAELSEKFGAWPIAVDAAKRRSTMAGEEVESFRHLQRLFDLRGDTWTARDYAQRARRAGDGSPELSLAIAHYGLLLGEDFDVGLAEAQRQVVARPEDFGPKVVLALAHLRMGEPEKARALLEGLMVNDAEMLPERMAILTAVFGANGLSDRARGLARQTPLSKLRPEERDLIRPWIAAPPSEGGEHLSVFR